MRKITYYATLMIIVIITSCKRDYLDINENPNQAVTSTPLLVLPTALNVTAGRLVHNQAGALWSGQWAPTVDFSGFIPEKSYDAPASWGTAGGTWNSCYDNINDYSYIEKQALIDGQKNLAGIAQVMKAFNYQLLVDAFGNVPYTKAGGSESGDNTPVYDSAEAIYTNLIIKLDEAIVNLAEPIALENVAIGAEDIYFKGNMKSWAKFANTLKLRILLRQSEIPARDVYIKAEIKKLTTYTSPKVVALFAGKYFLGLGENVESNPGYLKSAGKLNPFWLTYGFTEAGVASGNKTSLGLSAFAISKIENGIAPRDFQRMLRITTPSAAARYAFTGIPFGITGGNVFKHATTSTFGPGYLNRFDQPMIVMTASEALMLQAEAIVKGYGLPGDYKALFKDGVRSSFILLKAGAVPLEGAPAAGQLPDPISDYNATGPLQDVDYAQIKLNFDATEAQSIAAANNYLTYRNLPAGTNEGTVADIDAAANPLDVIMGQKFICLIGFSGFETWCDVRKYQDVTNGGSPLVPSLNVPRSVYVGTIGTSAKRPLRFPYPSVEQQTNSANLNAAISAQNLTTTIIDTRIFWDVK